MKKQTKTLLAAICMITLLLTGCNEVAKDSNLTCVNFSEREKLIAEMADGNVHVIEFDFQNNIQGVNLWQEVWIDGKCINKELITCRDTAMNALCLMQETETDEKYDRTDIESIQWELRLREPKHQEVLKPQVVDYIPESAEPSEPMATLYREINLGGGENIILEPSNSYILFAQEINLNKNGIFGTSAKVSMKEAEFLQKDDAVIALRMDTYTTLEEAEAAVAGIESTQDRRDKEKNEYEAQLKAELEAEIVDIIETAMEDTTEKKQ